MMLIYDDNELNKEFNSLPHASNNLDQLHNQNQFNMASEKVTTELSNHYISLNNNSLNQLNDHL